jgi:sigma-B regulation protein RsbU (phosphoserine phosphatase)
VSGDFYDFIPLNESNIGIVIADVTDKGMPAALFMADSRSIIRASVSIPIQPANAIASANRLISADSANGMFVSLFYGKLDITNGNLIYVNAGHNPPYLYQAESDTFSELDRTGLVLGIESDAEFEERTVQLKQGDFILLYTDGVTEATNAEQDLYGKVRLQKLLNNHRRSSAKIIQAAIEGAITEFIGDISPSDDISMMIAKRI